MNRQWRKTVPWSLLTLLIALFGAGLPLSFNVVHINASSGVPADPYAIRILNPLYSVLEVIQNAQSSRKIDPVDQFVITLFPTATRTPSPINIGNFVWDDLDKDGRQDAGEPGLPGVTVQLWNSAKTQLIDTDVTNASGIYQVIAPKPGDYRLRVLLPESDDKFSPRDQAGGDDQLDSDIIDNSRSTSYGFTPIFTLATNLISTTLWDAGIIVYRPPTATRTPTPINIGNFVWDDLDKDGRQDAGEPGLSGVVVQLWNSAKSQMIHSAVTNASGIYTVIAPVPGNYRIRVVLSGPLDTFTTKDAAGGDNLLDSDINPSGTDAGFTDIISIASNVISMTSVDAGIRKFKLPTPTRTPTPINIGNLVWNDNNQNGIQDAGEKGLNGITVQLWDSGKTQLVSSAVTNTNGGYTVVAPVPGDYRIKVLKPAGSSYSPTNQGGDDQKDSDVVSTVFSLNYGFSGVITLASNVISTTTWDAGLYNVPSTPTYTPIPSSDSDTIALYSKEKLKFAFFDSLISPAPLDSVTKVKSSAPTKGAFVMGDWDNDSQATPGIFKNGMFWYTNTISESAVWSSVWMGEFNKPVAVAGRFNAVVPHDCFGVVELEHDLPDDGFPLYYTCELLNQVPPNGVQNQFLAVSLPGTDKYQFVAGDWNGDNLDSIAVRRSNIITWSNIAPAQGVATFPLTQDFGDPFDGYGDIVAGDWDNNGLDSFGLFFKKKGRFFYRNDLLEGQNPYLLQKLGKPIGEKTKPFSWREIVEIRGESNSEITTDGVLPVPGTPSNGAAPVTLTPSLVPSVLPAETLETPESPPTVEIFGTDTPTFAQPSPTLTPTPSYFPTVTLSLEVTQDENSTQ